MITESQLFEPQLLRSSHTVITTCPNSTVYKFTKPEIFNFSESVQTVTFWVCSPGQTPSNLNLHSIKNLAAMQSTTIKDLIGTTLKAGWSLVAMTTEDQTSNIKITARVTN